MLWLPRKWMVLSSASLVLAFAACGEGLQAAGEREHRAAPVDPALRAERQRLSREVAAQRQAITALDAEARELDERIGSSVPDEANSPQVLAWRARLQDLHAESLEHRVELEARLDEIAALWQNRP